jgi:hypothetical protein
MNENNDFNGQEEYVYKKVMLTKKNSRAWSVASITLSMASLILCPVYWLKIILSATSIVFALISRKNIGYFDGLSLAGLIVGIFGIVFGILGIVMTELLSNNGYFNQLMEEIFGVILGGSEGAGGQAGPSA